MSVRCVLLFCGFRAVLRFFCAGRFFFMILLRKGFRDTNNLITDIFFKAIEIVEKHCGSLNTGTWEYILIISNCGQLFIPLSIYHFK